MAEQVAEREPGKIGAKTAASVAGLDKQPEPTKKQAARATVKPVTREKAVELIVNGLTWVNDMASEMVPAYGAVPGMALTAPEIRMEAEALADIPEVRKLLAVSGVGNPYLKLLWVNVVIVGRRIKLFREAKRFADGFGIKSAQDASDFLTAMMGGITGSTPPPATAG